MGRLLGCPIQVVRQYGFVWMADSRNSKGWGSCMTAGVGLWQGFGVGQLPGCCGGLGQLWRCCCWCHLRCHLPSTSSSFTCACQMDPAVGMAPNKRTLLEHYVSLGWLLSPSTATQHAGTGRCNLVHVLLYVTTLPHSLTTRLAMSA